MMFTNMSGCDRERPPEGALDSIERHECIVLCVYSDVPKSDHDSTS